MLGRRSLLAAVAVAVLATVAAGCSGSDSGASTSSAGAASTAVKIGYILPQTGELADDGRGAAQIAAVKYAVKVINEAGGVNGTKLASPPGVDESDDAATARANVAKLLDDDVDAVIGAAASAMTLAIIDTVVQRGVVECSGSNTTPVLSTYRDNGFYFRTAPSDALQGPVLGDLVVKSGYRKIVVAAAADDYGRGLQRATVAAITKAGGAVLATPTYDTHASSYDALVARIREAKPDALVLISRTEPAALLRALVDAGLGPSKIGVFGSDGAHSADLPELVDPADPDVLEGMMGTAPSSVVNQSFVNRLKAFDTSLQSEWYAPQVFDCVVTVARAAEEAASAEPSKIKAHMIDVTRRGTVCASFAECKKLLDAGTNINYDGVSGPLDFDSHGEPAAASIQVWQFRNGTLATVRTVTGT